jgi:hypothetical protein
MKQNSIKISPKKFDAENHEIIIAAIRNQQRLQGFFDGRFREKKLSSKKNYTRKIKHKLKF